MKDYFNSDLNRFIAKECRKDIIAIDIDLVINDYKKGHIKIIESKHLHESLGKGQRNVLERLTKRHITCFVIFGNEPFDDVFLYSFKNYTLYRIDKSLLIKFLNNRLSVSEILNLKVVEDRNLLNVRKYVN